MTTRVAKESEDLQNGSVNVSEKTRPATSATTTKRVLEMASGENIPAVFGAVLFDVVSVDELIAFNLQFFVCMHRILVSEARDETGKYFCNATISTLVEKIR